MTFYFLFYFYELVRILLKTKQPIQTKRQESLLTPTKRQASHTRKQAKNYRLGQKKKNLPNMISVSRSPYQIFVNFNLIGP
jgi:hypothetical protein